MKKTSVILLLLVLVLGIIPTLNALEVPRALSGIDLASARVVGDDEAATVRGEAWSPNGFPRGGDSWYVDGRVYQDGWKLRFSQNPGNESYKWWDLITNANKRELGKHGDIMVLNRWNDGTGKYGHVAYVESSTNLTFDNPSWTVTHTNWPGTKVGEIEGVNINKGTFTKVSAGKVNYNGGSSQYPLRGFLYKR